MPDLETGRFWVRDYVPGTEPPARPLDAWTS
jgi:hypothetical protein